MLLLDVVVVVAIAVVSAAAASAAAAAVSAFCSEQTVAAAITSMAVSSGFIGPTKAAEVAIIGTLVFSFSNSAVLAAAASAIS